MNTCKHKCKDCGFLAKRRDHDSRELVEVDLQAREQGSMGRGFCLEPVCLRNASEFGTPPEHVGDIQQFLKAERECSKYYQWNQGFSPKEHYEMQRNDMLQKEIEERRVKDGEEREARRVKDQEWREAQDGKARSHQTRTTILAAVLSFGFTGLGVFLGMNQPTPAATAVQLTANGVQPKQRGTHAPEASKPAEQKAQTAGKASGAK